MNDGVYGVVLYDFQAEELNELPVIAGETVTVISQPNAEWYVAKRIGTRMTGLIPVSYIKITDTVVSAYIDSYLWQENQYWFIVFAKLSNGKYRVLYRLFEGKRNVFVFFFANFLQKIFMIFM